MQTRVLLVVLITFAFAAIVIVKQGSGAAPAAAPTQQPVAAAGLTSSHADAEAAYEAARKTGKPIYLLFHSLTCDPCIEISAVADKVVPEYEGRVVFVNAISDDEPSQRLAAKFRFQYIPQSFFIDAKGMIVDSFEGAMDASAMRTYLDTLAAP